MFTVSNCTPEDAYSTIAFLVILLIVVSAILLKVRKERDKYLSDLFIANHKCAMTQAKFCQVTARLKEIKNETLPSN